MQRFDTYKEAEYALQKQIVESPDFVTKTTNEIIGTGFVLVNPWDNKNDHSNYEYAMEFFKWMKSGEKQLPEVMIKMNPWIKRFVETSNLPETFSSTYGWKIKEQMVAIEKEIVNHHESRRGYVNILTPNDHIILAADTKHEFPCTIGFQLFIRKSKLHMIVNMRSNNCWSVMPYDVYNFTMLQMSIAEELELEVGLYHHQINNAHIFKGDIRRFETLNQK